MAARSGLLISTLVAFTAGCHDAKTCTCDVKDGSSNDAAIDAAVRDEGESQDAAVDSLMGDASVLAADVVVDFNDTSPAMLPLGFVGLNTAEIADSVEYTDVHYRGMLKSIGVGWLRFPGGTADDPYDWTTGDTPDAMVMQFSATNNYSFLKGNVPLVRGRTAPIDIDNFHDFATATGVSGVVVINGFTDTAASAGALAGKIAAYSPTLPVAAYELSNEPYFTTWGTAPAFWTNAQTYLDKMAPYASKIHASSPKSHVTIFATYGTSSTPSQFGNWNDDIRTYQATSRYWDGVSIHYYEASTGSSTTFAQVESIFNHELLTDADTHIPVLDAALTPAGMPGQTYTISEYNVVDGGNATVPGEGTAYAAIFLSEYAMRMSTLPNVRRVGPHVAYSDSGSGFIAAKTDHEKDVTTAYANQTTVDTAQLAYGYYLNAPGVAFSILCGAINPSDRRLPTTVAAAAGKMLEQVAAGASTIDAIYAQSYQTSTTGHTAVVITNKGSSPQNVQLAKDGAVLPTGVVRTVTELDAVAPDSMNSATATPVTKSTYTTTAPVVRVPAFSIVSVAW